MKVIIDIPDEKYKLICSDGRPFLPSYKWIKNGTPIPDNATNGDVLEIIFPRIGAFDEWYDEPYQKGGKDEVN